jgi:hypothetical protein
MTETVGIITNITGPGLYLDTALDPWMDPWMDPWSVLTIGLLDDEPSFIGVIVPLYGNDRALVVLDPETAESVGVELLKAARYGAQE